VAEASTINDARALLRSFEKSEWKACHVKTDVLELFMSRDPEIRVGQVAASVAPEPAIIAELTAPHIGTLAFLAAPGTRIAAGAVYGRIAVLDEERDLISSRGGVVDRHFHAAGAQVEYGQPLVALTT
jgi:biotin carboxyl carrier protein